MQQFEDESWEMDYSQAFLYLFLEMNMKWAVNLKKWGLIFLHVMQEEEVDVES